MKNDCEGWTGEMGAAAGLDVDSNTRPHDTDFIPGDLGI